MLERNTWKAARWQVTSDMCPLTFGQNKCPVAGNVLQALIVLNMPTKTLGTVIEASSDRIKLI
jgi:hypothetical protein